MKRWMWVVVLTVILALSVGRRVWASDPPEIVPVSDGGVLIEFGGTDTGSYYIPGSFFSGGGLGGDKEFDPDPSNPTQGTIIGGTADHPVISGYYESTTRPGYYIPIQVKPSGGGEDEGTGYPRCPCGTMQKECTKDCNGDDCTKTCEQYCAPDCAAPTCGSAYPQQTQTSRTSGDFYIYIDEAIGGQTNAGYHGPSVLVDVWSESGGQDDYRRYEAAWYGTNKYYLKFDLASHPGMGTIHVHPIVRNWPSGLYTSCPEADFTRVSYASGRVYYDPTGTCSTAQPWTQTSNLAVGYNNGGAVSAGPVISTGDYAGIYVVGSNTTSNVSLQLINLPSEYICSDCNSTTCPNRASVAPGSTGNNIFLTDAGNREAWWQVTGAGQSRFKRDLREL